MAKEDTWEIKNMKYVFENLNDQRRIPLIDVTWDKIKPKENFSVSNLPINFSAHEQIKTQNAFERWYKNFIKNWGTEGDLVEVRPSYWKLQGNKQWDEEYKRGVDSISRYYDEKGSGGYTGD